LPFERDAAVWRSVRAGGDTKTRKSRRTLALPARCVHALTAHYERQGHPAGDRLVFATSAGTALDRHNVLRAFRPIIKRAGLDSHAWTPRELRHSFVSLLSSNGVSIEDIADLCGRPARPSPRACTGTNSGGASQRRGRHGPDLRR
jgi:site-specific recombinase XerD